MASTPATLPYRRLCSSRSKKPPGKGEDVTLMTNLIQGAVVPLEQNSACQAVNKDMGLTVRQRLYGSGDYRTGLSTALRGGQTAVASRSLGALIAQWPI